MKKVLLSVALLFTFALTYANEGVSKKESSKEIIVSVEKKALDTEIMINKNSPQQSIKVAASVVMPVCFILSCGQLCDTSPTASDEWAPYMQEDTIEGTFNILEAIHCGG